MGIGTVSAIIMGMAFPYFSLLFGQVTNVFSKNKSSQEMVDEATELCIKMIYLGIGTLLISVVKKAPWMIVGERMNIQFRIRYLISLLR